MKILITDSIPIKIIKEKFPDLVVKEKLGLKKEELLKEIPPYDILIVRSETKVDKDIINAGKNLKLIARAGVGVDNIDVEHATKKGIIVVNSPGGNTISAAEHTIAHMLNLARCISAAHQSLKNGKWERKKFIGQELNGKTLGIIGLGKVGTAVAKLASSFNMRVIGYDPYVNEEHAQSCGIELQSFDAVISQSDFITFHIPHNKKTHHLISEAEIKKMKDGVKIINCARGGLIDEKALFEALKSGKVSGAALDVFEQEPVLNSPLLTLENVVATPHLGASTNEALLAVTRDIATQIRLFVDQKPLTNAVNLPSISFDAYADLIPFFELGEKLGKFLSYLIHQKIEAIEIVYAGDVAKKDTSFITRYVIVGLFKNMFESNINYVNALLVVNERGIKVVESQQFKDLKFRNLITIFVYSDSGKKSVSGTYLGEGGIRILRIDDYWIDFVPENMILIIWYEDKPGVIGRLGTFLGNNNINIAGMQVGRGEKRGEAVMALSVDDEIPEILIPVMERLEGIHKIEVIHF